MVNVLLNVSTLPSFPLAFMPFPQIAPSVKKVDFFGILDNVLSRGEKGSLRVLAAGPCVSIVLVIRVVVLTCSKRGFFKSSVARRWILTALGVSAHEPSR